MLLFPFRLKVTMPEGFAHRVLVLGHSFVWRLENFIRRSTHPCVEPDFALPQPTSIHFHGIGGRTVHFLQCYDLAVVRTFQPTILILEIGSNDLCNPNLLVNDLAFDLLRLIYTFHFTFSTGLFTSLLVKFCRECKPLAAASTLILGPKI